ncbi:DUF3631 domain-containing protein [Taklimakanibacter deserti]|uniref:DUF3631 domain-containing protein n=1 Tax=Taklimakanibacter deserti TaxID=2267839 RepID=UPI000E6518D5
MSTEEQSVGKSLIREAIDSSEEFRDPLFELIKRSASDPGLPFTSTSIDLLIRTRRDNLAEFERTWAQLKKNGVRVSELKKLMSGAHDNPSVRHLAFDWKPENSWLSRVDGVALLDELVSSIKRFVVTPKYAPEAMALWILFAHSLNAFCICPRLAFVSPEKRCGKTTALSVIRQLVPRPLPASNITPAAIFRSIESFSPTLIIDEADTYLRDSDALRGILNSGHSRSMAFVIRTVGDDHEPKHFSTWAAIVVAMIGTLPDTLSDRAIVIELRRKGAEEVVQRLRIDRHEPFSDIRARIKRWTEDSMSSLEAWDGEVPKTLNDRAADNWRPLLAIADTAGGKWPELAREVAQGLNGSRDDESFGTRLLGDLFNFYQNVGQDRLKTEDILSYLISMEDRPWPEWRQGKPITARQLATLLKPFGILPRTIRFDDGGPLKGYLRNDFDDAFSRYLSATSVTSLQSNNIKDMGGSQFVTEAPSVTCSGHSNALKQGECYGVTDRDVPSSPELGNRRRRVVI